MATLVSTVIDRCSQVLNDEDGARFTKASLLLNMWEALKQFSRDSKAFQVQNYVIPLVANQEVYIMRSDFISIINLYVGKEADPVKHQSNTERNRLYQDRFRQGKPRRWWNQGLPQQKIGLWPIPDSDTAPDSALVTPSDGSSGEVFSINPSSTDLTGHCLLEFTRYASLPSPLTTHNGSSYSNDANLDSELLDEYWDKFHLLICALATRYAKRAEDQIRHRDFSMAYQDELLSAINANERSSRKIKTVNVRI